MTRAGRSLRSSKDSIIASACIRVWRISVRWSSSDGSVTLNLVSTKPRSAHPDPYFSDIQPIQILQTSEQWTADGAEAAIQSEMALGTFFFSQHWHFESSNVSSH